MSVNILYRVSVDIPEHVWREHGHTAAYGRTVIQATEGALAAGSNRDCDVEEWAEFDNMEAALECEKRLLQVAKGSLS